MTVSEMTRRRLRVSALALLAVVGCSGGPGFYPVEGVVVHADDASPATELKGYTVEFESVNRLDGKSLSAVGTIGPDATFTLTTNRPGDGALTGDHRVLISPPVVGGDGPAPPRHIDAKYCAYETSGLKAAVKPQSNKIELKIDRKKR
jgi:hypothetical protein